MDFYSMLLSKSLNRCEGDPHSTFKLYVSGQLTEITADMLEGVTSIGKSAFENCDSLTNVTIPNSVTTIGDMAFENNDNLVSITIPNSVTSIGEYVFRYSTKISSITIPDGITTIKKRAFEHCIKLSSITFPNNLQTIEEYAFIDCIALKNITFSEEIKNIGNSAFARCTALENIIIPGNVTNLGSNSYPALSGCTALKNATIGTTSIYLYTFSSCTALENISIQGGTIDSSAFSAKKHLTSVLLGQGITYIGSSAFYDCSALTSVTVKSTTPPNLGGNVFTNTSSNLIIYVPSESVDTYKSAAGWSDYASKIQAIPSE